MSKSTTIVISDEAEVNQKAQEVLQHLKHSIVLFIGDLGAGKTTLIKGLLGELGSADSGSSPSFSIINEYKSKNGKLYHLDLYRLRSAEEAFQLGIEDFMYSGDYCFIEWPQLIMDYLEPPYHILEINITEDNARTVEIKEVENLNLS